MTAKETCRLWDVGRLLAALCVCAGCWPEANVALPTPQGLRATAFPRVYILAGSPAPSACRDFAGMRRFLLMAPGISSGDLQEQSAFLDRLRRRTGADAAIFLHWGQNDPTRKVASPLATAAAARDLEEFCLLLVRAGGDKTEIDVLAHSAGTIVTNKAAICLQERNAPVSFRHVLFLGTPHDPETNFDALKARSRAVLNLHSDNDKINRNVSGDTGRIHALTAEPYWNLRMDTSLGGRKIRHYAFLENNPENWTQYSYFLARGSWLSPQPATVDTQLEPEALYRAAAWVRQRELTAAQQYLAATLARSCLAHAEPEVRYYGALLTGLLRDQTFRPQLKQALTERSTPGYLRREIYQALGAFGNPEDLRYLQQARKTDPESGDALRDILRDWKRDRIRLAHPNLNR